MRCSGLDGSEVLFEGSVNRGAADKWFGWILSINGSPLLVSSEKLLLLPCIEAKRTISDLSFAISPWPLFFCSPIQRKGATRHRHFGRELSEGSSLGCGVVFATPRLIFHSVRGSFKVKAHYGVL